MNPRHPNIQAITQIGNRPALYAMDANGNLVGAKVTDTGGITGYMSFEPWKDPHYDLKTEYVDPSHHVRPQRPDPEPAFQRPRRSHATVLESVLAAQVLA